MGKIWHRKRLFAWQDFFQQKSSTAVYSCSVLLWPVEVFCVNSIPLYRCYFFKCLVHNGGRSTNRNQSIDPSQAGPGSLHRRAGKKGCQLHSLKQLVCFLLWLFRCLVYFICKLRAIHIKLDLKSLQNTRESSWLSMIDKIPWSTNMVIFLCKLYLSVSSLRVQEYGSALLPSQKIKRLLWNNVLQNNVLIWRCNMIHFTFWHDHFHVNLFNYHVLM